LHYIGDDNLSEWQAFEEDELATDSNQPSAFRKITLLPLLAATYLMVAGGPYGLEDLVKSTGYGLAIIVLLLVPLFWSLPTALMVSELSSAIPEQGGYYVWVRRALGPFWGFQEAWLSLAASIFDMAIYPVLFVTYLGYLCKVLNLPLVPSYSSWLICVGVIVVCVLANIRGVRVVGGSSLVMLLAMLGPFVVLLVLAFGSNPVSAGEAQPLEVNFIFGITVAMWNFMGWDNASTIAGEVDRPQRTYPLALGGALLLVVLTYILPVLAAGHTGLDAAAWKEGSWVDVGSQVAGWPLAAAIAIGGMVAALGTFNSLVLSYSRVPFALAQDGYLPSVFTRCHSKTGAPWVAILVCAIAWTLALQLSLRRLFALDVILYGLSLILEFAALVALRIREPQLARPFKVPGGLIAALALGLGPTLLIGLAIVDQSGKVVPEGDDPMAPAVALILATVLAALGPVVYFLRRLWQRAPQVALEAETIPIRTDE
jgi:amino acid transporter